MNLPLVAASAARPPLPGATDPPAGAHFGTSFAAAFAARRESGRPASTPAADRPRPPAGASETRRSAADAAGSAGGTHESVAAETERATADRTAAGRSRDHGAATGEASGDQAAPSEGAAGGITEPADGLDSTTGDLGDTTGSFGTAADGLDSTTGDLGDTTGSFGTAADRLDDTAGTIGDTPGDLGGTAGLLDGAAGLPDGTTGDLDGTAGSQDDTPGELAGTAGLLDGTIDGLGRTGGGDATDGLDGTADDDDPDDATGVRDDGLALAGALAASAPVAAAPGADDAAGGTPAGSGALAGAGQTAAAAHARPGKADQSATGTSTAATDSVAVATDSVAAADSVTATGDHEPNARDVTSPTGQHTGGPLATAASGPGVVAPTAPTNPAPAASAAAANLAAPDGGTALAASDTVRYLRELGPARSVQRLAVDLDGSTVAVRIDQRGAQTSVQVHVLDDPSGRLGDRWTSGVERTLTRSFGDPSRFSDRDPEQRRRRGETARPDQDATAGVRRRWADALAIEGATR